MSQVGYRMTKNRFESGLDRIQDFVDSTKAVANNVLDADYAEVAQAAKEVALDAIKYKRHGGLQWASIGPVNLSWSIKKTVRKPKIVEPLPEPETVAIEGNLADRYARFVSKSQGGQDARQ